MSEYLNCCRIFLGVNDHIKISKTKTNEHCTSQKTIKPFFIFLTSQLNGKPVGTLKKRVRNIFNVYINVYIVHVYDIIRLCFVCLTFCLPSGELKLSYTVDNMKKRLTDQPNRVLFNAVHFYHYMQVRLWRHEIKS